MRLKCVGGHQNTTIVCLIVCAGYTPCLLDLHLNYIYVNLTEFSQHSDIQRIFVRFCSWLSFTNLFFEKNWLLPSHLEWHIALFFWWAIILSHQKYWAIFLQRKLNNGQFNWKKNSIKIMWIMRKITLAIHKWLHRP